MVCYVKDRTQHSKERKHKRMKNCDYLCLACGTFSTSDPSDEGNEDQSKCPQCGSTNVVHFSLDSLYGLLSGSG